MWNRLYQIFVSADFIEVFIVVLVVFAAQVAAKYITKLRIWLKDPRDPDEMKEAHFECFQVGLDLAFIGLLAAYAVFSLAKANIQGEDLRRVSAFEDGFVGFQFVLILCATGFSALYYSPKKHFWKGVWYPAAFGFVSILGSAAVYFFLMGK